MITGKQRSYLRALANTIKPIFQVGKGGINDNMIKQFNDALEVREFVKATVLRSATDSASEICNEISKCTNSDIVQVIGNKFVLYKESKENRTIILP